MGDYLLRNTPPALWKKAKAKAERTGTPLRIVIFELLKAWTEKK